MVSLGRRPSSRAEMLIAHCDECWLGRGWRGCFVRGNVINNMLEDEDNDTKDGDKAQTVDNRNCIGNWIIITRF